MQDHDHHGIPPKLYDKPAPLPFLSRKTEPPKFKVHTAETTINGKTYITQTIETSGGSTTKTYEKTPISKFKWTTKDIVKLVYVIFLFSLPIWFFVYLVIKGTAAK